MSASDDILRTARERLHAEADAVRALADTIDDDFIRAASMILRCKGKLFIGGSGTSGTVARRMAHILSVSGTPSIAFSPMDSLHGGSGAITSHDLVLLISNGGHSNEVINVAHIAQQRGARVIAITRSHETPLAKTADHDVVVEVESIAELGGVIATGSTLAHSAWGDALAEVLMGSRGYTWAEFMSTHPAGAVGTLKNLPDNPPHLHLPFDTDEEA